MSGGNDKLERELESFLADDSRVAALYRRLPKDEPDAKLDAAVLAQARAAVAPRRARPRWLPAMSAAAAVVIAAGLAYRVGPQVWSEHSAVSEKAVQRVAAPASAPTESPKDMASPTASSTAPMAKPEASAAASLRSESVSGAAIPEQNVDLAPRAEADKLQSQKRKVEDRKTTTNAFAKQAAQGQLKADAESARDNASAPMLQQTERMNAPASPPRLDGAPAPAAESPATQTTFTVTAKPVNAPEATAFPAAAGSSRAPAPAPPPPPAQAARAPARESAQSAMDVEVNLYPEHWIADIQQMLKKGRRDDAIRNVKEFRKRYPSYTLPENLRDLK